MDLSRRQLALGITNCRRAVQVVERIVEAERSNIPMAFIAEDIGCADAFQMAAVSAIQTTTIRLAIGVTNPYSRSPMSLAMSIATLDELSHGRAVLGLGSSSPEVISGQLGIAYHKPVAFMREAIDVVRALLAGRPLGPAVTFEGRYFRLSEAGLGIQHSARIPLYLAAMGPLMLTLAGSRADGVLLNVGTTPAYIGWARDRIIRGAESANRSMQDIGIAVWVPVYIGDDLESSLARARRWAASMLSIPRQGELILEHAGLPAACLPRIRAYYGAYPHRGDLERAAREVPDEIVWTLAVIGKPDDVCRRLVTYIEAGADTLIVAATALFQLTPLLE